MLRSLIAVSLVACGGEDPPAASYCDHDQLSTALAGALPAETLRVGDCDVTGDLTIPPGVTLEGVSENSRVIASNRGITIEPGLMPTVLSNLTVVSSERAGITARGAGSISIENVRVEVSRGLGIGIEEVEIARLFGVRVVGAVDEAVAQTLPLDASSQTISTHGILILSTPMADLDDVEVSGFALFGMLALDSAIDWSIGRIEKTMRVGLLVQGGSVRATDVAVSEIYRGGRWLEPSYGGAFAGGAAVTTERLEISGAEDFGLLHDGTASVSPRSLSAHDNTFAAVWAQDVAGLEVTGTFADNGLAGIAAVDSTGLSITDVRIERTRLKPLLYDSGVRVGDGIQLVRSSDGALIDRVVLTDNERVGMLLELGGAALSASAVGAVTVEAAGSSFGVIAQGGEPDDGWDAEVMRLGSTTANDMAISGPLETVAGVGPCYRPTGLEGGLDGLLGP